MSVLEVIYSAVVWLLWLADTAMQLVWTIVRWRFFLCLAVTALLAILAADEIPFHPLAGIMAGLIGLTGLIGAIRWQWYR